MCPFYYNLLTVNTYLSILFSLKHFELELDNSGSRAFNCLAFLSEMGELYTFCWGNMALFKPQKPEIETPENTDCTITIFTKKAIMWYFISVKGFGYFQKCRCLNGLLTIFVFQV